MGAIEDCRVTLDPVMEENDRVLAVGFFASRVRESGERFDFPFAILVELRDGKIARLAEYFDTRPLVP
jgi:ketosteroid isomerase-like protein